ncbi:MAG: hypothetical protein ABIH03_07105, partial [Pseudomonadota bacterium]
MNLDMDPHRWRHDSGLSLVGFSFIVFLLIVAVFVMFAFLASLASVPGCASGESPQVAAIATRVDKIETRATGVEALTIGGCLLLAGCAPMPKFQAAKALEPAGESSLCPEALYLTPTDDLAFALAQQRYVDVVLAPGAAYLVTPPLKCL